jgi:hypothetical protein
VASVSRYERLQISAALGPPPQRVEPGTGLVLLPHGDDARSVYRAAVEPALDTNAVNVRDVRVVFDEAAPLAVVADWVGRAEVVVADVSGLNPCVLYVLGLCHGHGRCPILVARADEPLPFGLDGLRVLRYRDGAHGLAELRERLTRAVRTFLAASRSDHDVT